MSSHQPAGLYFNGNPINSIEDMLVVVYGMDRQDAKNAEADIRAFIHVNG